MDVGEAGVPLGGEAPPSAVAGLAGKWVLEGVLEAEGSSAASEGEEGAVVSSGGRSRACVDFGHRRGRLRRQHRQKSTLAIASKVPATLTFQ